MLRDPRSRQLIALARGADQAVSIENSYAPSAASDEARTLKTAALFSCNSLEDAS